MAGIKIKSPKTDREVELNLNFGEGFEDARKKYGDDLLFTQFKRMCINDAGNKARAMLNDPAVSVEDVKAAVENWIPGQKIAGITRDPIAALAANADKMTDEQLLAMQERLRAVMKARKGA